MASTASTLLRGAATPLRACAASRIARSPLAFSPVRCLSSRAPCKAAAHPAHPAALAAGRTVRLSTRASAAAAATEKAAAGDYVEVHYTGTLDDGSVFDSSREREPLAFQIGAGRVIKGFDMAVTGLGVGETRKQRLQPADAYGEPNPDLIAKVPKEYAPDGLQPGMMVRLQNGMQAMVTEVSDAGEVTIDANPPLAGKALTFDVELVKLAKAASVQRALFGAGCFWGVELAFQRVPGVLQTAVGYAQGEKDDPSYEEVCSGQTGHTEVVEVVYDPAEASFETLLDLFFEKHDPTQLNRQGNDVGTQYRSGVYYTTPEQKAVAEAVMARVNQRLSGQVVTELEEAKKFWPAEEYHQQYLEKGGRFGRPQSARKGCSDPIRCYG